ncbi:hypothetical protein CBS101457_001763 [Exobasidium rhododendri]|nr:hypothetical protein CBS101457_001763 [Exobasidium rhododendri]
MTLTQELLASSQTSSSYAKATQHSFLVSAGKLQLSSASLQAWLTQDRLYALCGYSIFLGLLISRCPAPIASPTDPASRLHRKRLTVFAGAMANIDREVGFFEEVARSNNLDLGAAKDKGLNLLNPVTRGYIDYMIAVASRGTFEEALVLLWAMEKLYLDAWTFASSHLPSPVPASSDPGPSRALLSLIPNWSSPDFQAFVNDLTDLVDELDISLDSEIGKKVAEVWKITLWYEERFWEAGEVD